MTDPQQGTSLPVAITQPKPRKVWVDAVRGLAICLVVVGHVLQFGSHERFDYFTNPVFVTIYTFHMPLFILISGYLGAGALSRLSYPKLVTSRLRSIVVPFVLWTLVLAVTFGLFILLRGDGLPLVPMAKHFVGALVFPERGLWFLWVLFLCYCLAGLAWQLPARWRWPAVALLTAAVWAVPLNLQLAWTQLKWMLPFFLAGVAAKQFTAALSRHATLLLAVSAVAFVVLRFFWHRDDSVYLNRMQFVGSPVALAGHLAFRYAIALAGSVALILLVRLASHHMSLDFMAKLGTASLGIYTVQQIFANELGNFPAPTGAAFSFGYVPLVVVAMVAVSYAATVAIGRWPLASELLLGGRGPAKAKPALPPAAASKSSPQLPRAQAEGEEPRPIGPRRAL